jgi:hypothetical protein
MLQTNRLQCLSIVLKEWAGIKHVSLLIRSMGGDEKKVYWVKSRLWLSSRRLYRRKLKDYKLVNDINQSIIFSVSVPLCLFLLFLCECAFFCLFSFFSHSLSLSVFSPLSSISLLLSFSVFSTLSLSLCLSFLLSFSVFSLLPLSSLSLCIFYPLLLSLSVFLLSIFTTVALSFHSKRKKLKQK